MHSKLKKCSALHIFHTGKNYSEAGLKFNFLVDFLASPQVQPFPPASLVPPPLPLHTPLKKPRLFDPRKTYTGRGCPKEQPLLTRARRRGKEGGHLQFPYPFVLLQVARCVAGHFVEPLRYRKKGGGMGGGLIVGRIW